MLSRLVATLLHAACSLEIAVRGEVVVDVVDPQARGVIGREVTGGDSGKIRRVVVVLPGSSSRSCMFPHAITPMRRARKLRGSCVEDCVGITR